MTPVDAAALGDAYEQSAADFARTAHRLVYEPLAHPLIAALKPLAQGRPARVLDVAAGVGAFGSAFPDAVAIDLSAGMLTRNPSRFRVQADAERLPFRDDAFAVAGCAFGINHVDQPDRVVGEMARVAPVVAATTWARPEPPYAPKTIVNEELAAQVGEHRSDAGRILDRLGDRVGSVASVTKLLRDAGLEPEVRLEYVELPWPGVDAFLEYRLGMPSTPPASDLAALRAAVWQRIASLSDEERVWRAAIVIGVGVRV